MPGSQPGSMRELIDTIERSHHRLMLYVDGLPSADRDLVLDQTGWSAKDHISHVAMWERSISYILTGRPRHQGLGVPKDIYLRGDHDAINEAIFQQHRDQTWASARSRFEEIHREMISALERLNWDDLQQNYSHFAPDEPGEERGIPMLYYIAGNTLGHYDEHRDWIAQTVNAGGASGRES